MERFRARLDQAGLIRATFTTAADLELEVLHALTEAAGALPLTAPGPGMEGTARGRADIHGSSRAPLAREPLRAWGNVPARNPAFAGREEQLARIRQALAGEGGRAAVQALHGMGGVGKTQLAIEYAHRHSGDYDVTWWLDSENTTLMTQQYADLAEHLGAAWKGLPLDAMRRALLSDLHRRPRWLLVFDNARAGLPAGLAPQRPGPRDHHVKVAGLGRASGPGPGNVFPPPQLCGKLGLHWLWPDQCQEVIVSFSAQDWPHEGDAMTTTRRVSRAMYDQLGYYDITGILNQDYYISLRAVIKYADEYVITREQRLTGRIVSRVVLGYEIKRSTFLHKKYTLQIMPKQPGALPALLLIAKRGRLPMNKTDGDLLYRVDPRLVNGERIHVELPMKTFPTNTFGKLFLEDDHGYEVIIIHHPGIENLRLN